MEQSAYPEYINKSFQGVSHGVVEKLNGGKGPLPYLHVTRLRKEYSVTGTWDSITVNGSAVAADYVSMDSSIPLKSRDSLSKASGDIPKQGMELAIREQELTNLQTMIATRQPDDAIAAKFFQDVPRVIQGIYEKNEYAFLQGLSTGITSILSDKNTGAEIRLDFKYPAERKFTSSVVWTAGNATPLSDIRDRVIAKASLDGYRVTEIWTDLATANNILKSTEAKDLYAMSMGNFGTTKPKPSLAKLNEALTADDLFGFSIKIIDRSVVTEKNGVRTSSKPWAAGAVVALTSEIVGTLTHATLAEKNSPVAGVAYETVNDYILVSKFRTNRPSLAEFTQSQARVVPVISEVVYLLDSLTAS